MCHDGGHNYVHMFASLVGLLYYLFSVSFRWVDSVDAVVPTYEDNLGLVHYSHFSPFTPHPVGL